MGAGALCRTPIERENGGPDRRMDNPVHGGYGNGRRARGSGSGAGGKSWSQSGSTTHHRGVSSTENEGAYNQTWSKVFSSPFTKGEQDIVETRGLEAQPLVHMGPNVAFHELVARLAAAKFENEVPRQSLIPQLGTDTLGRTMADFIPYAWMGTLLTSLKAYSNADANWTTHPLSQAIWQVVNEEIRAKRQGRQSTPTGNPMGNNNRDGWSRQEEESSLQEETYHLGTASNAASRVIGPHNATIKDQRA